MPYEFGQLALWKTKLFKMENILNGWIPIQKIICYSFEYF